MDITTEPTPDLAPIHPSTLPDASPDNPLEALSWLGDTVEEIADGLRARGIKGRRNVANACPLANYLKVWYNDPSIFMRVSVIDEDKGYYYCRDTPKPCVDFINYFDSYQFPDLIEP